MTPAAAPELPASLSPIEATLTDRQGPAEDAPEPPVLHGGPVDRYTNCWMAPRMRSSWRPASDFSDIGRFALMGALVVAMTMLLVALSAGADP